MHAAGAQAERREQSIEFVDAAPADQRDGARQGVLERGESWDETRRRHDCVRPFRQIQQRSVDIQEYRDRIATCQACTERVRLYAWRGFQRRRHLQYPCSGC